MGIGSYPTRITAMPAATAAAGGPPIFAKRDDETSPIYGGNKIRKLEGILDLARARGATRLVTVGAVGSHHVLSTAIFGRRAGFAVDAIVAPQPATAHAEEVARIVAGLEIALVPVGSFAAVPVAVARRLRAPGRPFLIAPGGSTPVGSVGFVRAAGEIAAAIGAGLLPTPLTVVVALGSGGTVAGLLAGLAEAGLAGAVDVLAVRVVDRPFGSTGATLALAAATSRRAHGWTLGDAPATIARLARVLRIDDRFVGAGYGHPTPEGARATAIAAEDGLVLDPTYTAKAFAAALAEAREGRRPILFWQTLAAPGPFEALLREAPAVLPTEIERLLVGPRRATPSQATPARDTPAPCTSRTPRS
jgi:D-cysteine desulfhydrase